MTIRLAAGIALAALFAVPASAQEIVLKGASGFPEGTAYSVKFEAYVKQVNEKGKGLIRINYLGGAPKVMPTFDVGKNLRDGLVDIISNTGAYYTNVVPEADAQKLLEVSMAELRKNGGMAYLEKIYNEKMKAHYLARIFNYDEFHIYLNKEIKSPDFTGLKIRVTPIYRAMVEKLGGTAVTSAPPDVYSMLERNTVDGYGWPARGIFDFSWEKVTKYRVDPGFYNADLQILVNLDVWTKKLNDKQRSLLTEIAMAIETDTADKTANDAERKKQEAAGIKVLRFSAADEKKYLQIARDAGWEAVIKASPEHGPKLREYFTKKN
ncbi:MAG TPA: TRAP transporter substrate-binding protein DctP [Alphaproteobacteria bacterium]|jgi:TRAP-type C4-dicarboxylate transport system substrate-binding protein